MDSKSLKIHSKSTSSSFPGICWICHQSDTPISKQNFRFPNFFFRNHMKQQETEIIQKSKEFIDTFENLEQENEITKNTYDPENDHEKINNSELHEIKKANKTRLKDKNNENTKKREKTAGKIAVSQNLENERKSYDQKFQDFNKKLRPCLCKGTLGNVHEECLNAWALKKYQTYINLFSENEENILFENEGVARNEFKIKCPNCKYALKYEVHERKSVFVYYDLRSLYYEKVEQRSFTENISHILYIITVCIILSAGTFNFLDLFGREMVVEVKNMEN